MHKVGDKVLVATQCRPWPVVVGKLEAWDEQGIWLTDARMIVYYSASSRGLCGIAKHGLAGRSRVSPRVDKALLGPAEHVLGVTDAAWLTVEAEPWI